jgi:hypothetical protein
MALNPFFLQGSQQEQFLLQDLINEHLKMYGIDVYYLPRKILGREKLSNEIIMSKFDDNFIIEAYLNNFEGYGKDVEIMSKFGIQLKNEISLIISQERFELFIEPFLEKLNLFADAEIEITQRPREGDLIYFPLGQRIFEIKNVEHEKPFFQLGKNYVYELSCELFQLEDEIIDTSINEIDNRVVDEGYITQLILTGVGHTAYASAQGIHNGAVRSIDLINQGYDYSSTPIVSISTAPSGGVDATAVAITTSVGDAQALKEILLINPGHGYTTPPTVTITGGGGSGAAATAILGDGSIGIVGVSTVLDAFDYPNMIGAGYSSVPTITVDAPVSGNTADVTASIGAGGSIAEYRIRDAGSGYTSVPEIVVDTPTVLGLGTFISGEIITGSLSGATARVKNFDKDDLFLNVYINSGNFTPGETITGSESGASYTISSFDSDASNEIAYAQNEEIELEADNILDFTESNPFGGY